MNTYELFIQQVKKRNHIYYRIISPQRFQEKVEIRKVTLQVDQIKDVLEKLIIKYDMTEVSTILEQYFLCLKETHKNYPVTIRLSENCSLPLTEKTAFDLAITIISTIEREILSRIAS